MQAEKEEREISVVFGLQESLLLVKQNGMNYSTFMNGLKKSGIEMNRKMLSEIAIADSVAFAKLVETA